jgi:hypothetical protein
MSDRGYDVLVFEDGVENVCEDLERWSLAAVGLREGGLGLQGIVPVCWKR